MPEIKYPGEEVPEEYDPAKLTDEQRSENQAQVKKLQERLGNHEEQKKLPPEVRPAFNIREARASFDEYIQVVDDMFAKAKAMVVTNDASNVDATELGTSAMALYKKILATKSRVPFYDDAKDYVDVVDSLASMLTEKLYSTSKKHETIVSITKAKISEYAAVLEANRRKQEALELKAREDLQKQLDTEAEKTGTIAPKVGGPLISSKRETTVRTEKGSAYAVHLWDFQVEKPELPLALLTEILSLVTPEMGKLYELAKRLDEVLRYVSVMFEDTRLRKGVKDGIRNVEGVRIFEKIDTRFKT